MAGPSQDPLAALGLDGVVLLGDLLKRLHLVLLLAQL